MAETIVFIASSPSASATSFCTFATARLQSRLPDLDAVVAVTGLDLLAACSCVIFAAFSAFSFDAKNHVMTGWANVVIINHDGPKSQVSPY